MESYKISNYYISAYIINCMQKKNCQLKKKTHLFLWNVLFGLCSHELCECVEILVEEYGLNFSRVSKINQPKSPSHNNKPSKEWCYKFKNLSTKQNQKYNNWLILSKKIKSNTLCHRIFVCQFVFRSVFLKIFIQYILIVCYCI